MTHQSFEPASSPKHLAKKPRYTPPLTRCFVILGFLLTSYALAFPPLQTYNDGTLSFQIPVGWQVSSEAGVVLVSENLNDDSAPSALLITVPNNAGYSAATVTELLYSLPEFEPYTITEIGRSAEAGGVWTLTQLGDDATSLYFTSFAFADANTLVLTAFSAPEQRFVELGGALLMFAMFGQGSQATPRSLPALEPVNLQALTGVRAPRGWQVTDNTLNNQLVIQESQDPFGPTLVLSGGMSNPQLTDLALVERFVMNAGVMNAQLVSSQTLDLQRAQHKVAGDANGTPLTLFFQTYLDAQEYVVAVFAAPSQRYDQLGGDALLDAVFFTDATQTPDTVASDPFATSTGSDWLDAGIAQLDAQQQEITQLQQQLQNQGASHELQSMMLEQQQQMFNSWINTMSDDGYCWADAYGQCY